METAQRWTPVARAKEKGCIKMTLTGADQESASLCQRYPHEGTAEVGLTLVSVSCLAPLAPPRVVSNPVCLWVLPSSSENHRESEGAVGGKTTTKTQREQPNPKSL